ncbi:MAG: hypothetical protein WCF59_07955 [Desulfobaccales bacterium]
MKKIGWLLLIMALGVWGCVTADNTTLIDTDQQGYASGQYRDTHRGQVADFGIYGGGGGAGAAAASRAIGPLLSNTNSGSVGGGMAGLKVNPAPTQGDPLPFARSIAMINYSKRLSSIKYDETGGIIEYEFNPGPMSMRSAYAPPKAQEPSAFGHQPIE